MVMENNYFSADEIFVIVNPISGTGSKKKIVNLLSDLNEEYSVRFFYTRYSRHATQIASEAVKRGVRFIIAVGGDGTINEVAQALVGTDVALGIIPSGSGNGLARHLRIPMGTNKAIGVLRQKKVIAIDYGIANDNLFFCTCGVGYDALVSEKALSTKKRGVMMYAKNMFDTFLSFEPEQYNVITTGGSFSGKALTITCANASQYGNNAYIAPNADISDGMMNIAILNPLSFTDVPRTAFDIFTKRINNNPNLHELICSEALIERENEGVMHLDGNAVYTGKNINIRLIHRGLNVLVP